jgi:hypothetical protein
MFWEQFWPQFTATVLGLCLSIPITIFATFLGAGLGVWGALLLSRRQDKKELLQEKQKEEKTRRRVIDVLITELILNEQILQGWKNSTRRIVDTVKLARLKNEAWGAFRDGGELEFIKDPTLLWLLSEGYASISAIQKITDIYIEYARVVDPSLTFANEVYLELDRAVQHALGMLKDNLDILNLELKEEE